MYLNNYVVTAREKDCLLSILLFRWRATMRIDMCGGCILRGDCLKRRYIIAR